MFMPLNGIKKCIIWNRALWVPGVVRNQLCTNYACEEQGLNLEVSMLYFSANEL